MSVMRGKDGNELYLDCTCGCDDGIRLRIDNEDFDFYCFMSYTSGNWYRDCDCTMWRVFCKKLRKIWSIIRNKDYHHNEVVMTKDDFNEFREYINGIE